MLSPAVLLCLLALSGDTAETAAAVGAAPPVTMESGPHSTEGAPLLPAGTTFEVELAETLRSDTTPQGYRFAIRLAEPVVRDGVTLVEAGAVGEGEVIDVAKAGMNGRQGKLIIAARRLVLDGQAVQVRGMTAMASGASRVGLATGLTLTLYASPVALFIEGGEIEFPEGMRATVRLTEDFHAPVSGAFNGGN
jgi:hypothetical protein